MSYFTRYFTTYFRAGVAVPTAAATGGRRRPRRPPLNLIQPVEMPSTLTLGVISARLDDWTGAITGTVTDSQIDMFLTFYSKVA